jgi:alkylation response protein AidB-like acyl-CoA dehydrogenase
MSTEAPAGIGFVERQFAALLASKAEDRPSESFFQRSHSDLWRELVDGGWLTLGVDSQGAQRPTIRQLANYATVWGRHLFPLPFVPSLLVTRWTSAMTGAEGAGCTYSVPVPGGGGLAPFGVWPGVAVVASLPDERINPLRSLSVGPPDALAPSVPLVVLSVATRLEAACLNEICVLAAAEGVGAAERAAEQALAYANEREAYGRLIGTFQAVRHLLVDMHRDLELAKSALVWAATEEHDNFKACDLGLRLCQAVVARAIHVHGGIGFTWDLGLHYYLRHVLSLRRLVRARAPREGLTTSRSE